MSNPTLRLRASFVSLAGLLAASLAGCGVDGAPAGDSQSSSAAIQGATVTFDQGDGLGKPGSVGPTPGAPLTVMYPEARIFRMHPGCEPTVAPTMWWKINNDPDRVQAVPVNQGRGQIAKLDDDATTLQLWFTCVDGSGGTYYDSNNDAAHHWPYFLGGNGLVYAGAVEPTALSNSFKVYTRVDDNPSLHGAGLTYSKVVRVVYHDAESAFAGTPALEGTAKVTTLVVSPADPTGAKGNPQVRNTAFQLSRTGNGDYVGQIIVGLYEKGDTGAKLDSVEFAFSGNGEWDSRGAAGDYRIVFPDF